MKFVLANLMQRVRWCPICNCELTEGIGLQKVCGNGCGKFVLMDVGTDGTVNVRFFMTNTAEAD